MSDQKTKEAVNTRTVTEAGSDAAQKGAQSLQGKTTDMAEMVRRTSQEAAQRTSENLELMKRLAETMASNVRETSSEMAEWAKQASIQQQEATRQLIQAHSIEEVLETQNRYVRDNLQSLLDFSAKILHRSAERVSEASGQLQKDRA